MPIGVCTVCSKNFHYYIGSVSGRFCSRKCLLKTKRKIVKCKFCNKSMKLQKSDKTKFCSQICMGKWNKKNGTFAMENSPWWRGGRYPDTEGYIHVKCPSHPAADCEGYVREHRLVIEESIGRYLLPREIVHHKNKNVADNRLENLELMDSKEHSRMHRLLKARKKNAKGEFI